MGLFGTGGNIIQTSLASWRRQMLTARQRPRSLASATWRTLTHRSDISRTTIARAYITGSGIEIGALHRPLRVPRRAKVSYVDRMSLADLRTHYPELASRQLVTVDIVDDGERLATIADGSQDFVIANHFLEHTQDPIGALQTFLRVLRRGGVLFIAVPDKRFTFDKNRPVTPLAHLIEDHEAGPEGSHRAHFIEFARLVNNVPEERVGSRADHLIAIDRSIHFHVWTPSEILELLVWLVRDQAGQIDVEFFTQRDDEMIFVLRKLAPDGQSRLPN